MLGTYYYHEIIRKTIISFGTLFNNINIKHKKSDGTILDDIKVGLAYGPQQKYLAKIQEQAELSKSIAITLPRMSFEMTNIQKILHSHLGKKYFLELWVCLFFLQ